MTTSYFPPLSGATLEAANRLSIYLADAAAPADLALDAQVIVLAGNGVLPVIDAACTLMQQRDVPVVISGGIGHSTAFLYQAVAGHPRYRAIATEGRPEAQIIADIARQFYGIDSPRLHCESRSTNCGENAAFTRDTLAQLGLHPQRAVLIQDPTMQRRTAATFARVWCDMPGHTAWINHPGVVPQLENSPQGARFAGEQQGLWPVDRWLSLLLGEIPRLQDTPDGYGPLGRDFIVHVDIPEAVMAAWRQLNQDPQLQDILQLRRISQGKAR